VYSATVAWKNSAPAANQVDGGVDREQARFTATACIYTAQRRRRKQHLSSLSDVADRRPNDRLKVCLLSYLTFPSLPRASSHPATGLYRGAIVQFIIHVNRNENDRAKVVRDVS